MINASRDFGLRGKGMTAENRNAAQALPFGRGENIAATVTVFSVLCYWIL